MLADLFRGSREDAEAREVVHPLSQVSSLAASRSEARSASVALASRPEIHIIAEIKRRSPSKGSLAVIPDPVSLALEYEAGGASIISVLTESRGFGGSLDDLEAVSDAVKIPVLRKDFISTEYQVVESRARGADLLLLIMAGLDDKQARLLLTLTRELGMEALVETHDATEVARAVDLGASIIGINARDLSTFELDKGLFGRLERMIPNTVVKVAESAVATSQDVTHYREQGAQAVLVGEALVTGSDPRGRVREFVAA